MAVGVSKRNPVLRAAVEDRAREQGLNAITTPLPAPHTLVNPTWSRRLAMEAGMRWLGASSHPRKVLLMTAADAVVAPEWLSANLAAIDEGADLVAGFVGRPTDRSPAGGELAAVIDYSHLLDRTAAMLDPEPSDPWPRHCTNSSASLAVRLSFYERIGGYPTFRREDALAFVRLGRAFGGQVRHAEDVRVVQPGRRLAEDVGSLIQLAPGFQQGQPSLLERIPTARSAVRHLQFRAQLRRAYDGALEPGAHQRLAQGLHLCRPIYQAVLAKPSFTQALDEAATESAALRAEWIPRAHVSREIRSLAHFLTGYAALQVRPTEAGGPIAVHGR